MCVCVCVCVCVCACACVRVCVSSPKTINNYYSGVMWHDTTPNDWLNKLYNFYITAVVGIFNSYIGVALELKCVIETNLIRLSYGTVQAVTFALSNNIKYFISHITSVSNRHYYHIF